MIIYSLTFELNGIRSTYLFQNRPTKADFLALVKKIWDNLKPEIQEYSWDLLLLAEVVPENMPDSYMSVFGAHKIQETGVIENEKAQKSD